jgi:hypothetical protein
MTIFLTLMGRTIQDALLKVLEIFDFLNYLCSLFLLMNFCKNKIIFTNAVWKYRNEINTKNRVIYHTSIYFNLKDLNEPLKRCDSSVGIVTGYGLDNWGSKVWLLAGAGNFSLHHHGQNGSWAHPASPIQWVQGLLPWGCSGWGMKLATHLHLVLGQCVEQYLHSPNMPSWHGAKFITSSLFDSNISLTSSFSYF